MSVRKKAADRKAEIEETALALAFEVGPDLVSTGMIAARLQLTQPAIYKHFPCKEDIWSAVAGKMAARISESIAKADKAGAAPKERLHRLVTGHLQLVQKYPALPDIMIARDAHGSLRAGRQQLQAAMGRFRNALITDIRAAVDQGTFRTDLSAVDAAALIFGVVQSLVLQMLISRNPATLLEDGERLFMLLLAGFMETGKD